MVRIVGIELCVEIAHAWVNIVPYLATLWNVLANIFHFVQVFMALRYVEKRSLFQYAVKYV